jgi:hypothetical protein
MIRSIRFSHPYTGLTRGQLTSLVHKQWLRQLGANEYIEGTLFSQERRDYDNTSY